MRLILKIIFGDVMTVLAYQSTITLRFTSWSVSARVHNKRREREYPTSMILPNALRKVMT